MKRVTSYKYSQSHVKTDLRFLLNSSKERTIMDSVQETSKLYSNQLSLNKLEEATSEKDHDAVFAFHLKHTLYIKFNNMFVLIKLSPIKQILNIQNNRLV